MPNVALATLCAVSAGSCQDSVRYVRGRCAEHQRIGLRLRNRCANQQCQRSPGNLFCFYILPFNIIRRRPLWRGSPLSHSNIHAAAEGSSGISALRAQVECVHLFSVNCSDGYIANVA